MIPVFLISDENYVKYAAVTIKSVLSGTKEKINFYLLDGGISAESKKVIAEIINATGNSVEFIPMDLSLFQNFPNIAHFSINTYFRYLIPALKPDIHKALYIDTDMVIKGDISYIYNTDMENYGIAAVPYIQEDLKLKDFSKYKQQLGISKKHLYFNAGLLLIDCDYWRKHQIGETLMAKTAELHDKLNMPDQDILNIVFNNNYKVLPQQYNIVVDLTVKYRNFNDYIKSLNGCIVFHYTGGTETRPWMKAGIPCQKFFWNIAKQTPFYDDLFKELLFNSLARIERKNNRIIKRIKLFGVIPFLKICQNEHTTKVYIFDVILLYTSKIKI